MGRPSEFDRETVLRKAASVFWAKGYAATSTEELVSAMGIGRQSIYNAFGDKWRLYLEALTDYQQRSTSAHIRRLQGPALAVQGIQDMLDGLVDDDDAVRALGCMGVGSACEFGATEPQLFDLRAKASAHLRDKLVKRLREGKTAGQLDTKLNVQQTADFLLMTMTGIQLAARSGAKAADLRQLGRFTVERIKASPSL
ncbi:TetR/AcrR family transcriptional regulator [Pinirhizobacter soli]|uniref:TetR/AcrR family transcriptional regulator n=1 Tax=Pinirhizobacter soli TaxID=2786953 RepID=UPI002029BD23|nr:TetR/AcrR family transcriptional regulator [Pinirhizobacter soli]